MKKKMISLLLALLLMMSLLPSALAAESPTPMESYAATRNLLSRSVATYVWAGNGGSDDWNVFALARDGVSIPWSYLASARAFTPTATTDVTECARNILALTACGAEVSDALLAGVTNSENMVLTNAVIYALLALDSKNYAVPTGGMARKELIALLLSLQQDDNAWGYSYLDGTDWITSYGTDVDTTAMAITALAPYTADTAVEAAVNNALAYLKSQQIEDGSFGYMGSASVESTAQVVVALTTLGIDPTAWNGKNAVAAMCTMALPTGGFLSTYTGEYNEISTYEGYYALVAYSRYLSGKTALYDMTDARRPVPPVTPVGPTPTKPEAPATPAASSVSSAKTADSGILLYGALSVMSLLGMGYTGKKRR